MNRFVFKLKSVLHHRQKKEDLVKKELAEVKRLYEFEKERLTQLNVRFADSHKALREKQKSALDATEISMHAKFIERLERQIEVQLSRVASLATEVRKVQERLLEAAKDRKVLEKLEEKQLSEYKLEAERVEQGIIDEIATVRHNRDDGNPLRRNHAEQS
ncbi:MAG: flagellar export protein FliJ [Candidatus Aquicultor sp.]|nr:flagellar export protein FliJ [Candidatus Aquicultor sp.]